MRGMGTDHVSSGQMRGLKKTLHPMAQTDGRTWQLYDWIGPGGRISKNDRVFLVTLANCLSQDVFVLTLCECENTLYVIACIKRIHKLVFQEIIEECPQNFSHLQLNMADIGDDLKQAHFMDNSINQIFIQLYNVCLWKRIFIAYYKRSVSLSRNWISIILCEYDSVNRWQEYYKYVFFSCAN